MCTALCEGKSYFSLTAYHAQYVAETFLILDMHSFELQIAVMWASCVFFLMAGLCHQSLTQKPEPMFHVVTPTILPTDALHNPVQLNYGMAVTDVDGDGDLEVVVAG